jgi:hypothetical protein
MGLLAVEQKMKRVSFVCEIVQKASCARMKVVENYTLLRTI